MADFAGIAGLGPKRIEAYEDRILAAIEYAVHAPAEAAPPPERPDFDVAAHLPFTAPTTAPASPEELISAPPLPQATGAVAERPAASMQPLTARRPRRVPRRQPS
ncbi:hypothetical protein GCM10008956_29840 [Deinococcus arenae]|uniref:Uncharacterized protein n=1 Tax=Deinococcus arenae TaxID=1452751 RepID=A0A8H9GX43_9DEIO|nr:hypothetical protein [Deinococcus arenae]GGM51810.1 hypothetical protein GCM10008956_29840 [Deinococcus arenae]